MLTSIHLFPRNKTLTNCNTSNIGYTLHIHRVTLVHNTHTQSNIGYTLHIHRVTLVHNTHTQRNIGYTILTHRVTLGTQNSNTE